MDVFALKCRGADGCWQYIDIPYSHCAEGIQLKVYPDFTGNSNQQFMWNEDKIISKISLPNFCLAVQEVKEGAPLIIHSSDSGSTCSTGWIFHNGRIALESHAGFCLGLSGSRVVLKKVQSDEADSDGTRWETQAISSHNKPASSCHLRYEPISEQDIDDSWSLETTVCVKKSADCTYYCVVGWGPGGYSGIQRVSDTERIVIFSMWNDRWNSVREVKHGAGVRVQSFGGEGTGMKSMKSINWRDNQKITLRVSGRKHYMDGNASVWQCTGSYSIDGGDFHLMATFERSGESPLNTTGFYSFIEDWRRDHYHQGHLQQREAEYSDPKLTTSSGHVFNLERALFTKQSQDEDAFATRKAFAAVKTSKACFVLSTGGKTGEDIYGELGADGCTQRTNRNYAKVSL